MSEQPLLEVRRLVKHFRAGGGWFKSAGAVRAVDDVSLSIDRGTALALVGESGSGKTTLGRVILRLIDPTGGSVSFDGTDVLGAKLRGVLNSPEYWFGSVGFDIEATKGGDPTEFDYASVQLGVSWRPPLGHRIKFAPFFYAQYFDGYGETLIRADEHTRAFRVGIRLVL